jgi:hypothetical protein
MSAGSTATKRALTRKRNAAKRLALQAKRRAEIIAAGGPRAARERLYEAGALSTDTVRRRIQWLAHERKLSDAQIKDVMKCRTDTIGDFIEQHCISGEWLLAGDLKAFHSQEMRRRRAQ